jgi:hypothetical protein
MTERDEDDGKKTRMTERDEDDGNRRKGRKQGGKDVERFGTWWKSTRVLGRYITVFPPLDRTLRSVRKDGGYKV